MPRILIASLLAAASLLADTKVRSTLTTGGQTTETLVYSKVQRQRIEYGQAAILIHQCDRRRTLQLDAPSKTFFVLSAGSAAVAAAPPAAPTAANEPQPAGGGETTINSTVTDTGETKPWFGYTARRVKTKVETIPGPGSCHPQQGPTVMETDGWYIDLPPSAAASACSLDAPPMQAPEATTPGCRDRVKLNSTGVAKLGFPVAYTVATTAGGQTTSMSMEVTELDVKASLPDALFEVPEGFSDVNAKKPGLIRVAVAVPADKTGQAPGLANEVFRALRQAGLEPMAMPAGSAADIDARAKQTNADFVLYSELVELKKPDKPASEGKGKRFGGLMGKATGLLNSKEAWEARIDYRLFAVGSPAPVLSTSATGRTGGEGFNVKGAVNLAANVGMVVAMGPMGMMMQGGPMSMLAGMGGGAGALGGMGGGASMIPGLAQMGMGRGINPALGGLGMLSMAGNLGMGGAMGFAEVPGLAGGAGGQAPGEPAKAWQAAIANLAAAVTTQVKK